MNIEEDIFKRTHVDYDKLIAYGFRKENNYYVYEKIFLDNKFKAIIIIDNKEKIIGKVIDLKIDEEYTNIRTNMIGDFVSSVRSAYEDILKDIRDNCFIKDYFSSKQANRITKYILNTYNTKPEFLWEKSPYDGIFRNNYNGKWFGIIMNIDKSKLDKEKKNVDIINVKLDINKINELLNKKGYYKAYHMNKNNWLSIILDDTLKDEEIINLINESYDIINEPDIWIIPANPKYYDVINCFNNTNEIIWKQSSDVHINDIVYLYVAEPYSKIMYECIVTKVNIPYEFKNEYLRIDKVMNIKLLKKLDKKNYTFSYLKGLGIKAIRGPRKINKKLD